MYKVIALCIAYWVLSPPASASGPKILGKTEDELSGILRGLLLQNLPDPLYDKAIDWGKTKDVKVIRMRDGKPVVVARPKNDGLWKKIHAEALNPRETLIVDLRDVNQPSTGALTFTLFIAADVRFEATQDHWESGIKLFGASIKARAKVRAKLTCEASIRPELVGLLPELVCTLKITKSEVGYENLVVEHVAGLGGDAAKVIGAAGHGLINQWKPSLERHLLDKANHAILKAGQNKEVRLSLGKLFKATPKK